MASGRKKGPSTRATGFSLFDDPPVSPQIDDDRPLGEAGRQKIKKQYVELLGIRKEKLKGRILNRERINKEVEGIYFICVSCEQICHNLDEGLVEDENNEKNVCVACDKAAKSPTKQLSKADGRSHRKASKSTNKKRSR
ncbi:MAG: hypothetical protein ACE5D3_02315 [Candidatus Binatia bacterium]